MSKSKIFKSNNVWKAAQDGVVIYASGDLNYVLAGLGRKYRGEFPDFRLDVEIPKRWVDASYRNDACPSWLVRQPNGSLVRVFVDYADPQMREYGPDQDRFAICDEDGSSFYLSTNDWSEVLSYLEGFTIKLKLMAKEARPQSHEDYGSDRQVHAFNRFTEAADALLTLEQSEHMHDYAFKATNDEIIDEYLRLLGA